MEVQSFAKDKILRVADENDLACEVVLRQSVGTASPDVTTTDDGDAGVMGCHDGVLCAERMPEGVKNYRSLAQFDFGCALPALILRGLGDGGDMRVIAEIFAQGSTQDAHAGSVHDANARQPG